MKKNFKFMLVALLAFVGVNSAKAALPATIEDAVYQYTIIGASDDVKLTANVFISGIIDDDGVVKSDKSIYLPGTFKYTQGSKEYTITVKYADAAVIQNHPEATSVVIPKQFVQILPSTFDGCSSLKTITFEAGSEVTTIGANAFATTQITKFDFSPCTKLAELPNEVFVEPTLNNTFITEVTVPTGPLFKHINGAFKNLDNLTAINGLGSSYIQEVIAEAFDGCDKLETLALPGNNLRYIDANALEGSSVKDLTINVSSLISLGGGTVNANTYAWTAGAFTNNIYGASAIDATPLESLTLTGTLTGKIAAYAFGYCDAMTGILDLTNVTFGSTGQLEANAFATCYDVAHETGIEGVKIKNITDNNSGNYTFAGGAFNGCDYLTSVEIENITTAKAVGAGAFGVNLKSVKIGTVKADGEVFEAGAFVWGDISGATLDLAQGTGEYLNSNNVSSYIIPAGVFDMSAIVNGTGSLTFQWPAIKIGEIKSKGGVFAAGAIKVPATLGTLTFTGAIAANGLDKDLLSGPANLTAITFKGAIGMEGIKTGAFANVTTLTTLTFEGLLAENAVAEGAFEIADDATSTYTLAYTCAEIPDYTVNPFNVKAFSATSTKAADRFIKFSVANENLLANYQDEANGLNGTAGDPTKFDIYLVEIATAAPATTNTFTVYRNENEKKMAWGRYDLGKFALENKDGAYTATNMKIARIQNDMKITIYGMYTDEDANGQESTVYMVPLFVQDGYYKFTAAQKDLLIIKAESTKGDFAEKDIEVEYDNTDPLGGSYFTKLGSAEKLSKAADTYTNQQLWDKTSVLANTIWLDLTGTEQTTVQKALYVMTDPAKYKGFRIDKNNVEKGGAYVKKGWWYTFLHNFQPAAAARIVWMDEAEATAIYGVKEVKNAAEDGAIYNLQGVRVNKPAKGLYIQNGKKFVVK